MRGRAAGAQGDLIDHADFSRGQSALRIFIGQCPVDHRHPEDAPTQDAENGDEINQALGGSQFEFFGIEIEITPGPLRPIECLDRGELVEVTGQAVFAGLPREIAERMLGKARQNLAAWPEEAFVLRELPADQGPGVILMLEARHAHVTELVSGFGQLGVSAERLAKTSAARMSGYVAGQAFAGPYLADQLILPFVLARGGSFSTVKPSQHLLTAIEIAQRFTGLPVDLTQLPEGEHLLSIGS